MSLLGEVGTEGFFMTLVLAIVVGGIGYFLFFPRQQQQPVRRQVAGREQQIRQRDQARPPQQQRPQEFTDDEDDIRTFLKSHKRVPPHFSGDITNLPTRLAQDGIVPFRFTKAANFEQNTKDGAQNLESRKERARLFAKMYKNSTITPAPRGAKVVVSIAAADCGKENVQRALFLIGSYYSLFLVVAIDNEESLDDYEKDKERTNNIVSSLYSSAVPKEILPSHRVVVTRSLASRVAFVRSFPKIPDLIIAGNEGDLSTQLTKFGYTVILRSLADL